jgi:hypothetical protein
MFCVKRIMVQRDSHDWQDMFHQLTIRVRRLHKGEPRWTLEYVKQRLDATLLLFEQTTNPGEICSLHCWAMCLTVPPLRMYVQLIQQLYRLASCFHQRPLRQRCIGSSGTLGSIQG